MTVTTRHIPVAFDNWLDDQSKQRVTTLCGRRSPGKFTGIPGITEQPVIVYDKGRAIWGWCLECAYEFSLRLFPPRMNVDNTPTEIFMLHNRAGGIIRPAAEAYVRKRT